MVDEKSRGEILMDGFRAVQELSSIAKEAGINREILTKKNLFIASVIVGGGYFAYRRFRPTQVEVIK